MSNKREWTAGDEEELLLLLSQGKSNKEIAEALGRTYDSVDGKIKRMNVSGREIQPKPRVLPDPIVAEDPLKGVKDQLLRLTKNKGAVDLLSLLRQIGCSYQEIEQSIFELGAEGYEVELLEEKGVVNREMVVEPGGYMVSHFDRVSKAGTIKVGLISDNQLSNKTARLDVLVTAYDHFEAEGITDVYHAGNIIDGYSPRINAFEIVPESGASIEAQCRYASKVYPVKKDIRTWFVTGDCHEGWYSKTTGLNVGRAMQRIFHENGRNDLTYIGHIEGDIELRTPNVSKHSQGPILRVIHPGGGTAYAKSYKTQKWAESLQGGEKPQVALIGHYHKQGYFLDRNIHCVLAACTADQSIFMRKLLIPAEIGYHIAEIKIGADGAVVSFKLEFIHFFDKGYYQNYERI